jgi:hypothetical protein
MGLYAAFPDGATVGATLARNGDIVATETLDELDAPSGIYYADFPSGLPAGDYFVMYTDGTTIVQERVKWDGVNVVVGVPPDVMTVQKYAILNPGMSA